jgi:hypothetical protein
MDNTGTTSQNTIQSNGSISENVRNRTHVLITFSLRMTDTMTSKNTDLPSRNRVGEKDNNWRPSQTTKMVLSRNPFGIGHMFIKKFLLRMTDIMTSQNNVLPPWDTLYILTFEMEFTKRSATPTNVSGRIQQFAITQNYT